MRTVTAADANRQFSSVLREVSQGETFTVVSRGRTGARDGSRDELYRVMTGKAKPDAAAAREAILGIGRQEK